MNLQRLIQYFEKARSSHGQLSPTLAFGDGGTYGQLGSLKLSSSYQPILNRQQDVVAYEALLRVNDASNRQVPPDVLFASLSEHAEVIVLDRLCRVMHAVNYVTQPGHLGRRLFLNVNARHLQGITPGTHGATFEALLDYCQLKPSQVVLEIIESGTDDLNMLQRAITAYKANGFAIAIDDFGSRHSNFDRLWALEPDIVKLDRSLLMQAQQNPRASRVLPVLVRLIQDLDAKVVCEGIETRSQHLLAMDVGADLLQGFYYAKPSPALDQADIAIHYANDQDSPRMAGIAARSIH